VTSPISGTWTLFQFHVLHLPNIHCVCISYSSLINALAIRFISAIFVQFISKPALFNKFCYFSLLVTFLHHKFYYLLNFSQNYSSVFNSPSPITNTTKAVSHENSSAVWSFFFKILIFKNVKPLTQMCMHQVRRKVMSQKIVFMRN